MSLGPLYVFLGEVSVQVLCPFFNWVVYLPGVESCEFFIYLGDQTLVWGIIGKYVFPYVWFSINLMLFSLAVQKFFILRRSHFYSFLYITCCRGHRVKILPRGISKIFQLIFSSRGSMVSWLIFKSFIHLEFIFVYGISWWPSFMFLRVAVQIPQHRLLKRLFLFHFMILPPLWNINFP